MSSTVLAIDNRRPKVRVRAVALPVEHGSWGFLFEPLVAGMAIAFSPAAPWIALMVIGAFLLRRPLQIFVADRVAGRWLPQTAIALNFILVFSGILLTGLAGSLVFADRSSLLPFALIMPLAAYQIYCDVFRRSRLLLAEMTGAVAMSSSAAAIVLAGGLPWQNAAAIWFLLIARLIPSIFYVRNRLNLEKGKDYSKLMPAVVHLTGLAGVIGLVFAGYLPFITVPVFLLLFARSAFGLSRYRTRMKAMKIGIWEVIYGVLTILSLIVGYYSGV